VIGTEVPWPLLQAIADEPDEALHRGLAHVQAAEFLYETSLFPEREYTFKHALTHEVAYSSLLHEWRRIMLHTRFVEALEALAECDETRRPRHALLQDRSAGADPCRAVRGHRIVSLLWTCSSGCLRPRRCWYRESDQGCQRQDQADIHRRRSVYNTGRGR
jgi:hypothetical protein